MPTNLTEEGKAKWAEAQATRDLSRKLQLLREFYSLIPKHKSTERLQMSIKRQMKGLEEDLERARTRRRGSTRLEWVVRKEGAVQLAVVGTLGSALEFFRTVTNLDVTVHQVLVRPVVGVLDGASVQFQLVLTPYEQGLGEEKRERFMTLARSADGVIIVVAAESPGYLEAVVDWFEERNVDLRSDRAAVELTPAPTGGVRILGAAHHLTEQQVISLLQGFRIRNAVVNLSRDATLDDLERAVFGRVWKRTVVLQQAADRHGAPPRFTPAGEVMAMPASRDDLARLLLDRLDLVRIYTKGVDEPPATKPLLLPRGLRVIDVAMAIHKDFVHYFQFAKVWRGSQIQAVRVGRNFPLLDGDVVEIHA